MATRKKRLTPREIQVLRWIAAHQPCSVRDAAEHFANDVGLARTTVLTVMERLRAQGYLSRSEATGGNLYRVTRTARALQQEVVDRFAKEMFDDSVSPFVAFLARRSKQLADDEIDALRRLVEKLEGRES